jgi:hypothetical protein
MAYQQDGALSLRAMVAEPEDPVSEDRFCRQGEGRGEGSAYNLSDSGHATGIVGVTVDGHHFV